MERAWHKETVCLETGDSLFLLVHNYAGSNFIGQYLAGSPPAEISGNFTDFTAFFDGQIQS